MALISSFSLTVAWRLQNDPAPRQKCQLPLLRTQRRLAVLSGTMGSLEVVFMASALLDLQRGWCSRVLPTSTNYTLDPFLRTERVLFHYDTMWGLSYFMWKQQQGERLGTVRNCTVGA